MHIFDYETAPSIAAMVSILFAAELGMAGTIVGDSYQITVATNTTYTMTSTEAQELIDAYRAGTVTEFRKLGEGTLASTSLAGYDGPIVIEKGIYSASSGVSSFGTNKGKTVIADGASLFINGYMELWYEELVVSGTGFGGQGVIRAVGGNAYLARLTMEDDCLFVGVGKYFNFAQDGNGPFNMNGHTLTISANQNTAFHGRNIINPGKIINLNKRFSILGDSILTNGPAHSITLGGTDASSDISISATTASNNWTLVYANPNSTYGIVFGSDWYGPIVLDVGTATAKLNYASGISAPITLHGGISGTGNLNCGANEYVILGNDTITGTISGSSFITFGSSAVVDLSKISVSKPVWRCCGGDAPGGQGFTAQEFRDMILPTWGVSGKTCYVNVPAGCVFDYPYDIPYRLQCAFINRGEGVFQMSGRMGPDGGFASMNAGPGTFRLTGRNDSRMLGTQLEGGRLELSGFQAYFTNRVAFSTYSPHDPARPTTIVITNSFIDASDKTPRIYLNEYSYSARMKSILEILADSVITNNFTIGYDAPLSTASVYMRGGIVHSTATGGADGMIGRDGQGYWEQTGGDMTIAGTTHLGYVPGSLGQHFISGGTCIMVASGYQIGSSGTGIYYQNGGLFKSPGLIRISDCSYDNNLNKDASGVMTVDGSGVLCSIAERILLARRFDSSATVNINNGATLETPQLVRARWGRGYENYPEFYTNDLAYVNFNGGILRAYESVEAFGYDNAVTNPVLGGLSDNRPTAVTIFPKGAVIDTSNVVVGVSAPLLAPVGQGVVSIPLPAGAVLDGYIAPPLVTISGDGTNATAIATIDSRTGTWTGITVTSPGWGYTTATASISRGGKTNTFEVACVLGDVSGGGLTKRGLGELHLKAVNTYTGATVVEKGRLVLEEGSSIASSSGVSVSDGATLAIATGAPLAVNALGGCGSIEGNVAVDGPITAKASDFSAGRYLKISGSLQFGNGASIHLEYDTPLSGRKNYTLLQASSGVSVDTLPAISGVGRNRAISVVGGKVRLVYLRHAVIFR